jgi:hypothetical protein
MSLEASGRLIFKGETQQVNDKFKKREFVIEMYEEINGNTYTNYSKFQCVQAKCEILDRVREGDMVKVSFNIKGNRWERDGKVNYITNLDAWRIETIGGQAAAAPAPAQNNYAAPPPPQQNTFNAPPAYGSFPATEDGLPF